MILESLNLNCKAFDKTRSKASKLCMLDDATIAPYCILKKIQKLSHATHFLYAYVCAKKVLIHIGFKKEN